MNVRRRIFLLVSVVTLVSGAVAAIPAAAGSIPSGERSHGQSVLEPVYNDEHAGEIGYIMYPTHPPDPVKANPSSWAPFYLVVYPVGTKAGTEFVCMHVPVDNCPTHGDVIAGVAQALEPDVYGAGVIGHDHLMDFPGGPDFNPNWEPIVVLFTSSAAANEHIFTDAQIHAAVAKGDAIEVPLPGATFVCASVPAIVYERATPASVNARR